MEEEVEIKKISSLIRYEPEKTTLNERQDILAQIHARYLLDKNLRKKENWTRYVQFLKENRTPDSKEMQAKFKKSRRFVKELDARSLAIRLAHIKTNDLYYIMSAGKDQKNFSAWLLSSIKTI